VSPRLTFQYVAGRATSYVFLGVMAGTIGSHALARLGSSARVWVAEAIAVVLVVDGLRLLRSRALPVRKSVEPAPAAVVDRAPFGAERRRSWLAAPQSVLQALLSAAPRQGLGLGLVTGFLPCGALLSALVLASSSGSVPAAAAGMLVFSLASLPGVLAPLLLARPLRRAMTPIRVPHLAAAAGGTVLILLGLWVAARPLRVGAHDACQVEAATPGAASVGSPAAPGSPESPESHGG
jgi:hypothetical protein